MYLSTPNNEPYVWSDKNEIHTPDESMEAETLCHGNVSDSEVGAKLDNPGAISLRRCTRMTSPQYESIQSSTRSSSNNASSDSNSQSPAKTLATSSMSTSETLHYSFQKAGRYINPTNPPPGMTSSHESRAGNVEKQNILPRTPQIESDDEKNARAQVSLTNTQQSFDGSNFLPQFEAAALQNVAAFAFQNAFASSAAGGNSNRSRNPSAPFDNGNGHGSFQPQLQGATLARNLIATRCPEASERAQRTREYVLAHQRVSQYGNENYNMPVRPSASSPYAFSSTRQRRPSTQSSGYAPMSYLSSHPDHRPFQQMNQSMDRTGFCGSEVTGNEQADMINIQAHLQVFEHTRQSNCHNNGYEQALERHTIDFGQGIPDSRPEMQSSMLAQSPLYTNYSAPACTLTIPSSNKSKDLKIRRGEVLGAVRTEVIIPDNDGDDKTSRQVNQEQGLIHLDDFIAVRLDKNGLLNLPCTWGGNIPGVALHQYRQQSFQTAKSELKKLSTPNRQKMLDKSFDGYGTIAVKDAAITTIGDTANGNAISNRFSTGYRTSDINNTVAVTATDDANEFGKFHAAVNVSGPKNAKGITNKIRTNNIIGNASVLGKRPRSGSSRAMEPFVPKKLVKRALANGTFGTCGDIKAPNQSVFMGGPDIQTARTLRSSKFSATQFSDIDSFGRWDEFTNSDEDVLDCIIVKTPNTSMTVEALPKNTQDLPLEDRQVQDSLILFPDIKCQSSNTFDGADDHFDLGGYFADATYSRHRPEAEFAVDEDMVDLLPSLHLP